ncbi:MAG: flagellar assembly peptidoglycan hydrolase FlgJ [Burkholderiaceae bacterium]|nr:flagellar assembly peptidoglycan hydrolase FlgJ [Burkholderiaceae bacterium]
MDPQPLLATDARSLDALRRQAGADPKAAVRAAAGQFESVFMRQMLKAMRDAVPKSGMWDGPAQSTYTDMLDQQMTQTLSGRPGGLAEVIARQLSRQIGAGTPPATGTSGAGIPGLPAIVPSNQDDSAAPASPAPVRVAPGASAAGFGAHSAAAGTAAAGTAAGTAFAALRRDANPVAANNTLIRQALAAFAATAGASGTSGAGPAVSQVGARTGVLASEAAVAAPARWTGNVGPAFSPAQPNVANLSGPQADFVRKVWPHALLAERSTGVPAAFIVGQAALESGWGRHEIRNANGTGSFNLFGIKAGGAWKGEAAAASTTEYVGGHATRRVERFRAYGSYGEAFQDWAGMMARNPRYSRVIQSGGSVQAFAANMQRAGYATDPAYGSKLEKVIQKTLTLQRLVT